MSERLNTGGTLSLGHLYVERPADNELLRALQRGEFCYVLAPRQIGKSSLRAQTKERLAQEGIQCASIDLTLIGSQVNADQWYWGIIEQIIEELDLPDNLPEFWQQNSTLSAVQRWVRFLRHHLLNQIQGPVVIFIDEIDAVLALPFPRDDFFSVIRALYNRRVDEPIFNRLTFCLLGVATPGDLMQDPQRTPFNIGNNIRLEDFTQQETQAFHAEMNILGPDASDALAAIYEWTSGHPYMTQRLCKELISNRGTDPVRERVGKLVYQVFLQRGRVEDPNLSATENYFRKKNHIENTAEVLALYRRLLDGEDVPAQGDEPVQMSLRLTGMAAERWEQTGHWLRHRNRIFAAVFNDTWLKEKEAELHLAEPLNRWLRSGRKYEFLPAEDALPQVVEWARGREDLSQQETEFINACLVAIRRLEEQRKQAETARRARNHALAFGVLFPTFLEGFVYYGTLAVMTKYFSDNLGISDQKAGIITNIFTALVTFTMFFLGEISDRWGIRRSLISSLGLVAFGRFLIAIMGILIAYGLAGKVSITKHGSFDAALLNPSLFRPSISSTLISLLIVTIGYGIYQPAIYSAVGRLTEKNNRALAYSLLYGLQNLGSFFSGLLGAPIRHLAEELLPPNGISAVFLVYAIITVGALIITYVYFGKFTLMNENADSDEAIMRPSIFSSSWWKIHPLGNAKFALFLVILIPVQTLFAHNWLTMPFYIERVFSGPWVSNNFELFSNFNPLLCFVLCPIVTSLAPRANAYQAIFVGVAIMASAPFLLVLGTHPTALLVSTVVMTIGEAIWQPRLQQYVTELAPSRQNGQYFGVCQLSWFLAKIATGLYSGWFLHRYCPAQGTKNPELMWLIYALIACISPVALVLAGRWMRRSTISCPSGAT